MNFVGTWYIYEMEMWDKNYFNVEVQAYIYINKNGGGHFQFGLVSCELNGRIVDCNGKECFKFTFEGNDECDHTSGSGWIELKNKDKIEGEFRFDFGDSSAFSAHNTTKKVL